jgi:protein tyrosine/serine phosphatase
MNLRRATLAVVVVVGAICTSYASYCSVLIWSGNFHSVEDDRFYRSGQLTKADFAHEIAVHHIGSVLNLRGANPQAGWYRDELAATRAAGAEHYDVGISARTLVPAEKIEQILTILRNAPKPILVHCKSGADRTGFVSALYRYAIDGQQMEEAASELSLWYGHFPYLMNKTRAMDDSASAYFLSHPLGVRGTPSTN